MQHSQPEYVNEALVIHQLHRRLTALGVLGDVLNVVPDKGSVYVPPCWMLAEHNPCPINWLVPPVREVAVVDSVWEELCNGQPPSLSWLGLGRDVGRAPDRRRWFGDGRTAAAPGDVLVGLLLIAARAQGIRPVWRSWSLSAGRYSLRQNTVMSELTGEWHEVALDIPDWSDLGLQALPASNDRLGLALDAANVQDPTVWMLARSAIAGIRQPFEALEQEAFASARRPGYRLKMPVVLPGVPGDPLAPAPKPKPQRETGGGDSDEVERLLSQDMVDMAALYRASVPGLCSARLFHQHIDPNPTAAKRPRRVRSETRQGWINLLLLREHPTI